MQAQPVVYVAKPDARVVALRVGVGVGQVKAGRKAAAVVAHLHRQRALGTADPNVDAATEAAVFQPVKQAVFHQRLDEKPWDQAGPRALVNLVANRKIVVAVALDQ